MVSRTFALEMDFGYGLGYAKLGTRGTGGGNYIGYDEGIRSRNADLHLFVGGDKLSFDLDFHTSSGFVPIVSDIQNNDPQFKSLQVVLGLFGVNTVYSRTVWGSTGYARDNEDLPLTDGSIMLQPGDPIDCTIILDRLGIRVLELSAWEDGWLHVSGAATVGAVRSTSGGYENDRDDLMHISNLAVVHDRASWGIAADFSTTMRFGRESVSRFLFGFGPEIDAIVTGTIAMVTLGYHLTIDKRFENGYSLGLRLAGGLFTGGSWTGFPFAPTSSADQYAAAEPGSLGTTFSRISLVLIRDWTF